VQLHLPKPLQQTLQTHLVTAYPEEGCALLIGRVTSDTFTVEAIQPVANAAPAGTRLRRYAIKPADIAQADRVARANGQDIIGVAHSHPDHPAVPSARDLAEAWPDFAYVILSVHAGLATDVRAWQVDAGRPLELGIIGGVG